MPEADPFRPARPADPARPDQLYQPDRPDLVAALRRWEEAGGTWQVAGRTSESVTVALMRCDGGEEADRLSSRDPKVVQALAGRTGSDEGPLGPND